MSDIVTIHDCGDYFIDQNMNKFVLYSEFVLELLLKHPMIAPLYFDDFKGKKIESTALVLDEEFYRKL